MKKLFIFYLYFIIALLPVIANNKYTIKKNDNNESIITIAEDITLHIKPVKTKVNEDYIYISDNKHITTLLPIDVFTSLMLNEYLISDQTKEFYNNVISFVNEEVNYDAPPIIDLFRKFYISIAYNIIQNGCYLTLQDSYELNELDEYFDLADITNENNDNFNTSYYFFTFDYDMYNEYYKITDTLSSLGIENIDKIAQETVIKNNREKIKSTIKYMWYPLVPAIANSVADFIMNYW